MYEGLAPGASMDEVLAHYGVLGMHWGIRKKEDLVGRKMSAKDKALLKKAGVDPRHSAQLEAKYGPGSNKEDHKLHLTAKQKKILIGVGVGVGVAAAVGAAYYFHQNIQADKLAKDSAILEKLNRMAAKAKADPLNSPNFTREWGDYQQKIMDRAMNGFDSKAIAALSKEPINLPAGHVVKRVTTELETTIRPGGFFAAHEQADVERYKAILPVFWKQWQQTQGKEEGYIMHLAAKVPIKAPSPRSLFDMFKGSLHDDVVIHPGTPVAEALGYTTKQTVKFKDMLFHMGGSDQAVAQEAFGQFTQAWAHGPDSHPAVQHMFDKIKAAGYNALPDLNDAGSLANNPLRLLDGNAFEIVGHEALDKEAIGLAQKGIMALAHWVAMIVNNLFYESPGGGTMELTHQEQRGLDFLEHYGVLGMKWGRRRARASTVQIKAARGRVATQSRKVEFAAEKAARIRDPKERAKAEKKAGELKLHFLNNPDRVMSARMTRGEKAVAVVLGLSAVGVGLGPSLAVIGGTSARSRRIERKQETGAYSKQFKKQNKN